MNKKHFFGIIIVLAIALFFGNQITGDLSTEKEIKIGSILILSGEGASWGNAARNGIDLAVDDINSNGGINGKYLSVNHQDDKSDPKEALNAFRKLVDVDGIKFIIGTTWSHTGLPLKELATEKKVLMVSPSLGVKEFNEYSKYLFNTWPHDFILSEQLADLVYKKGHRRIAVFGNQNIWVKDQTNAFKKRFEGLGGIVDLILEPNTEDTNLRPEVLKIKESNVDAVILTNGVMNSGPIAAKRMKEIGIGLPLYSLSLDKNIIASANSAYDDLVYLTFLTPKKEFEKRYKEKFSVDIDIGGDSAYDAVMMLTKAMKETRSTDTEKIQEYLNGIKSYDGVSGKIISDGKGGFTKEPITMEIKNGEPIKLEK